VDYLLNDDVGSDEDDDDDSSDDDEEEEEGGMRVSSYRGRLPQYENQVVCNYILFHGY